MHGSVKRRENGANEVKDWNIRRGWEERKTLGFISSFNKSSPTSLILISPLKAATLFTIDINHNEVFQCLIRSSSMHGHYLGLFRDAKSMLMAEHPVSDVLFSQNARRHLGKSQGRKMKVRGIANIHRRQLFMNIKAQLWKEAGSSSFSLIMSQHWNTLQLNGLVRCKVWHSVAAVKFN